MLQAFRQKLKGILKERSLKSFFLKFEGDMSKSEEKEMLAWVIAITVVTSVFGLYMIFLMAKDFVV